MNEHKKEKKKKKKDNKARGVDASDFDTSNTIEEGVEEVPSKSEKKRKEKRKERECEVREDNEVINEETFGSEDGTSEKSGEKCESEYGNNEKKMKKEKKKRKSNEPLGINCSEAQKESESEKGSDFISGKETTDSFREEKKNKGREKNSKLVASSSLNTSEECSDTPGDEGCGDLVTNNAKGKRRREDDTLESDKYEHRKTKKNKEENKEMKEKTSVAANGEDVTTKKKKAAKVEVDQKASKLGNGGDTNNLTTSKSRNNKRRVTFSGKVEVIPLDKDTKREEEEEEEGEGKLVHGKRFSKEEDELVKKAVVEYIDTNQLGVEGVNMIMNCKVYPEIKNCWRVIGASVPWRPYEAVYHRAHVLFQRSEQRKWEPEEYEIIKRFHKEHGPKWKMLADALGKHRFHVKDTWRRIRLPKSRNGPWSQEEYQTLFDLVNMDLRMKAFEEKKSKHGMLRDNIAWEAISEKLATRHNAACCMKWYGQLSSPLVHEGLWVDTDDYRLVAALQKLDAYCEEDVDWDTLLEHRSGDVCKKRWKQMTKHIGGFKEKSFIEQVDLLSKRYCPEMLEYRQ